VCARTDCAYVHVSDFLHTNNTPMSCKHSLAYYSLQLADWHSIPIFQVLYIKLFGCEINKILHIRRRKHEIVYIKSPCLPLML
jgi:hypothetical protein